MLVVGCYSKLSNQSMAGWRRVALAFLATAELLRGGWRGALWAVGCKVAKDNGRDGIGRGKYGEGQYSQKDGIGQDFFRFYLVRGRMVFAN
jgi:hypothetical protein